MLRTIIIASFFVSLSLTAQPRAKPEQYQKFSLQRDNFNASFRAIQSVHMKAEVLISFYNPLDYESTEPLLRKEASIEYWATDVRYKLTVRTDPDLKLAEDMEIVYDGSYYHMFFPKRGLLYYSRQESPPREIPAALPNPFFLPLDYLSEDNDACSACRLNLEDMYGDAVWSKFQANVASNELNMFTTPGGKLNGVDFVHRVSWDFENGGPARIERRNHDNQVIYTLDFSNYVEEHGFNFPRMIIGRSYIDNLSGQVVQGMENSGIGFRIEQLSLNQAMPRETFSISNDRVEKFWDENEKRFVTGPEYQSKTGK